MWRYLLEILTTDCPIIKNDHEFIYKINKLIKINYRDDIIQKERRG
jgi:hypothetical protein